jgi:hypothetical protein
MKMLTVNKLLNTTHKGLTKKVSMSNTLNYLVNLGFSLFGCNVRQREKNTVWVKEILTITGILKYGAQFNEDSQPILIELTEYTRTLRKDNPSRLLKPICSGQCDFEDGCVFTPLPTPVLIYPYRPTGPELGPVPMDISD